MQVIQLSKHIFEKTDLALGLYPYQILPMCCGKNKVPGGILEVVPEVRSRDELGKAGFKSLHDYFLQTFGRPDSAEFEVARRNMIRSLAASSIQCFLMWIKDRHNGNILVTSTGSLVHIDFGFILGISPGGNLGFETAAFKLTQEHLDIMGGSTETEFFLYFCELVARAFLLLRDNKEALFTLVAGMADSNLPCFHFAETLQKVRAYARGESVRACARVKTERGRDWSRLIETRLNTAASPPLPPLLTMCLACAVMAPLQA